MNPSFSQRLDTENSENRNCSEEEKSNTASDLKCLNNHQFPGMKNT